jgi:hypothetical protein
VPVDPADVRATDDAGFQIGEAEVIYWGRCPGCVAATDVIRERRDDRRDRERQRE